MNNTEIREAKKVLLELKEKDWYKHETEPYINEALQTLISLAQSVLDAKMPMEKKEKCLNLFPTAPAALPSSTENAPVANLSRRVGVNRRRKDQSIGASQLSIILRMAKPMSAKWGIHDES